MRLGVIGGGGMATYHAYNTTRIPHCTLVAMGSPEFSDAARNVAQHAAASCVDDAAAVYTRNDIDAVIIATPTDTHAAVAIAAMQHGKHVFVEKPLARTLSDASAIIEASIRYQRHLMTGHVVRYFADYAQAHQLVTSGAIGRPGVARTNRCGAFPGDGRHWYADLQRSGGVLLDLIVHDYDWLRWTFGAPDRIYARGLLNAGFDRKDAAMSIVHFASGVIAYAEASWAYPNGFRTSLEVSGSAGLIHHANDDVADIALNAFPNTAATLATDSDGHEDPYLAQLRDFVTWCGGGQAPRSVAEDGYAALRMSLAAIESVHTGRAVSLT